MLVVLKHPLEQRDSVLILLMVFLSAAVQVFLEAFRGDSLIWPGGFRAAQVVGPVIFGWIADSQCVSWAHSKTNAREQGSTVRGSGG